MYLDIHISTDNTEEARHIVDGLQLAFGRGTVTYAVTPEGEAALNEQPEGEPVVVVDAPSTEPAPEEERKRRRRPRPRPRPPVVEDAQMELPQEIADETIGDVLVVEPDAATEPAPSLEEISDAVQQLHAVKGLGFVKGQLKTFGVERTRDLPEHQRALFLRTVRGELARAGEQGK